METTFKISWWHLMFLTVPILYRIILTILTLLLFLVIESIKEIRKKNKVEISPPIGIPGMPIGGSLKGVRGIFILFSTFIPFLNEEKWNTTLFFLLDLCIAFALFLNYYLFIKTNSNVMLIFTILLLLPYLIYMFYVAFEDDDIFFDIKTKFLFLFAIPVVIILTLSIGSINPNQFIQPKNWFNNFFQSTSKKDLLTEISILENKISDLNIQFNNKKEEYITLKRKIQNLFKAINQSQNHQYLESILIGIIGSLITAFIGIILKYNIKTYLAKRKNE